MAIDCDRDKNEDGEVKTQPSSIMCMPLWKEKKKSQSIGLNAGHRSQSTEGEAIPKGNKVGEVHYPARTTAEQRLSESGKGEEVNCLFMG